MDRRRDDIGVRDRVGVLAGGDEAGEVGHVDHQLGADRVGDLAEGGEVELARVGGPAGDDQRRPVLLGEARDLVHVDPQVLAADVVGDRVVELAGDVDLHPVAEVAAVVERQPEEGVARFQQRHVGGVVGLGAGVRPGRWRARRRTAPWRGRSPVPRRRRPPRSRRSSGCRDNPRRTCWSAPSRPLRAPPGARSSPRRSSPAFPAGAEARPRGRRRSRDRPRPEVRFESFRVTRHDASDDTNGRDGASGGRCCSHPALGAAPAPLRPPARRRRNPCDGPGPRHLRCPNLRIGPPHELYVSRVRGARCGCGRPATSRSRGKGPMELRGIRDGRRIDARQPADLQEGPRPHHVRTEAHLHFTDVGEYFGGSYWKVHQLARFELWSVDRQPPAAAPGARRPEAELLPARPGAHPPRPALAVQLPLSGLQPEPFQDRVTLGTSVGWSDIYPADYTSSG